MAELEPKKKKAKVKPEVSVEEALEEKGAKWAKGREVPAVDDESESYSYEDYSYDLKSAGYLALEARIANPARASSTVDIQPDPAGASGTAGAQAASSAGPLGRQTGQRP